MLEAVFFTLAAALFVYQVAFFRKLTKKQVNLTLKTFNTDWEPIHTHEKVLPSTGQPSVLHKPISPLEKSINRIEK